MNDAALTRWKPYEPSAAAPWNLERVVHLHRRAAFAAPWPVLERDLTDGPQAAIERLLAGEAAVNTASDFEALADSIGDAAVASDSAARLQAWWFYRLLHSPDPLGERLTLMWHNHFATSNRKVRDVGLMREQNEILRRHARGEFAVLLSAVIKHPAMLIWLDADANRRSRPNENLARELMELFTLGIGNYTEDDVKQAARALTGWGIEQRKFTSRPQQHDAGDKQVLGTRGALDGDGLLQLLVNHAQTARWITQRICRTLLGDGVADADAIGQLAEAFRQRQMNIGWAVATVIRSELFFSDKNLRAQVVSPVALIVGALRSLQLCEPSPDTLTLAQWSSRLGQELFNPPNVGGWKEGRSWLSSRTIVARANFAAALVRGQLARPQRELDFAALAQQYGECPDWPEATAWFARLLLGNDDPAAVEAVIQTVSEALAQPAAPPPLSQAVALLLSRPEYQLA